MAGSLNKVTLIGNLTRDPEERTFANGGSIVTFSIATSETWKDKQTGERKERTQFHNVAIRNEAVGRIAMQYLSKGDKAYVEGTLEYRAYTDKDGAERKATDVVIAPYNGTLILLGSPASRSGDRSGRPMGDSQAPLPAQRRPPPVDDLDSDIPF